RTAVATRAIANPLTASSSSSTGATVAVGAVHSQRAPAASASGLPVLLDRFDPAGVTAAFELAVDEGADDRVGLRAVETAPGERHDVDIVVCARERDLLGVVG